MPDQPTPDPTAPPFHMLCPVCGRMARITTLGMAKRGDDLNIHTIGVTCPTHGRFTWTPRPTS